MCRENPLFSAMDTDSSLSVLFLLWTHCLHSCSCSQETPCSIMGVQVGIEFLACIAEVSLCLVYLSSMCTVVVCALALCPTLRCVSPFFADSSATAPSAGIPVRRRKWSLSVGHVWCLTAWKAATCRPPFDDIASQDGTCASGPDLNPHFSGD